MDPASPKSNSNRGRGTSRRGHGGRRPNNRGRGRGRGNSGGGDAAPPQTPETPNVIVAQSEDPESDEASSEGEDADLCWICAEPVKFYSVSECNHRTCHVCALRLRALYKKNECTLCKVSKHTASRMLY